MPRRGRRPKGKVRVRDSRCPHVPAPDPPRPPPPASTVSFRRQPCPIHPPQPPPHDSTSVGGGGGVRQAGPRSLRSRASVLLVHSRKGPEDCPRTRPYPTTPGPDLRVPRVESTLFPSRRRYEENPEWRRDPGYTPGGIEVSGSVRSGLADTGGRVLGPPEAPNGNQASGEARPVGGGRDRHSSLFTRVTSRRHFPPGPKAKDGCMGWTGRDDVLGTRCGLGGVRETSSDPTARTGGSFFVVVELRPTSERTQESRRRSQRDGLLGPLVTDTPTSDGGLEDVYTLRTL